MLPQVQRADDPERNAPVEKSSQTNAESDAVRNVNSYCPKKWQSHVTILSCVVFIQNQPIYVAFAH
jgi:hypothetical protein